MDGQRMDRKRKFHWKQAVEIGNETTVDNQRELYGLLSKLKWLRPALCRAVYAEMGITPREYKRLIKETETMLWREAIEKRKQAMKAEGPRPRGGFHNAAIEEIAPTVEASILQLRSLGRRMGLKVSKEKSRIKPEALKQRVRRMNLHARKTGRH
jgi:hypothetical protein